MTTPPSFSEDNLRDLLDEIEGNIIVGIARSHQHRKFFIEFLHINLSASSGSGQTACRNQDGEAVFRLNFIMTTCKTARSFSFGVYYTTATSFLKLAI